MVKKNRWFVKKPFKKSYNKISNIKRVSPPKAKSSEGEKISLIASELSKTRARETGAIKPEVIFSGDSSRSAKFLSKNQTNAAGPVKSGPIYLEESGRTAMEISKKSARVTGPLKPKIIYSDQIGREALKISSMKNKKRIRTQSNYSVPRYSVDFLRSLSRKSAIINTP